MGFSKKEINYFIKSLNLTSETHMSKYKYISNNELKSFLYGLLYYDEDKKKNYEVQLIPKKNNSKRLLRIPKLKLKEIQRLILENYLEKIVVSDNATGFVKKRGIIDNAKAHQKSNIILKIDLKNFFDNINENMIINSLKNRSSNLSINNNFAEIITYISTVDNMLPTGSPTSPYLSNIICYKLDFRINKFCQKRNITYTRYADDLTFSGNVIDKKFLNSIKQIIEDEELTINERKTKFLHKGSKKKITGYIVNEEISIGRKEYKNLLFQLSFCEKYGINQTIKKFDLTIEPESLKNHFLGKIKFAKVKETYYKTLLRKFNDVNWEVNFERIQNISIREDYLKDKKLINKIISTKKNIQQLNNLDTWLSNFESPEERRVALNVLSKIKYYTLYDLQESIFKCFKSYCTYRNCQISKIKNNTVITSVGNSSSSSSLMLKTAKNILGTEGNPMIKSNNEILPAKQENLIILDDFIGLGDAFLKDYSAKKKTFEKYTNISFIIPVVYHIGLKKIQETFPDVKIFSGIVLNEDCVYSNQLSKKEIEVIDRILDRNFASETTQTKYSAKEHILNVIFEHNIPNNSLPIYWSKSNVKIWNPLFPRFWFT